ncbi:MAG: hypothetical protein IRZ21_09020 [Thermoleophilaceae bacterium]|nr:hypothetical protein [Thermoleophilaceae bacterium]
MITRFSLPLAVAAALALPSTASARVIELGGSLPAAAPSCPASCQAIGRVSGYQAKVGSVRHPFQVKTRGKIVAFSITLGKPKASQVDFFNKLFGGPPQVRLSILRHETRNRYRLTGQSDVFQLDQYFGSTPTFALTRPLTVKKGYIVALTVPTWAPAFAVNLGKDQIWRSSRDPKRCDDVQQQAAQDVRGSLRTYGCLYKTARLLYSATFVPQPQPTVTPPRKRTTR